MIARSQQDIPHCRAGVRVRLRQGVTLVEMLVSVTITLLVVFAIVQVFDLLGETMAMGRATIEMAGQLRSATNRLQADLDNLTCPVKPFLDPASGLGYFEYVEGKYAGANAANALRSSDWDSDANAVPDVADLHGDWISHFGDTDDILAFTMRSDGEPFIGRGPLGPIQSNLAEVIWWVALADTNGNGIPDPWPSAGGTAMADAFVLLRRVLLIRPDLVGTLVVPATPQDFFKDYDISARFELDSGGIRIIVPNSLGDLTNRQNRFARRQSGLTVDPNTDYAAVETDGGPQPFAHGFARYFPAPDHVNYAGHFPFDHEYNDNAFSVVNTYTGPAVLPRFITLQEMNQVYGDLIILNDVLAWDVRAFDEGAVSYADPAGALLISPSDPVYSSVAASTAYADATQNTPLGAFVDLGYALPSGQPRGVGGAYTDLTTTILDLEPSNIFDDGSWTLPRLFLHFDTWSTGYENDGFNQNQDPANLTDEGTNGVDDNGLGGVDDLSERETLPPFDVALPGIEIRLRIMEFDTRQVRQASVVGDFTQ